MRPASADELFATITSTVESKGDEDLRVIEDELTEFMKRFPQDPRAPELTDYVEQLEIQRLQRKARLSSVPGTKGFGPIVQLYLAGLTTADSDATRAKAMFADLIDLYDPLGVTADGQVETGRDRSALTEEDRRWLVLARQELAKLSEKTSDEAKRQLPAVKERLAAAEVVARNHPQKAVLMYRAIIGLYGEQPWAAEAVSTARKSLADLENSTAE
jgi:hypothetical protein